MSRFVLDCAVARPVDADVAQWLGMAATRAWAHPSGGYHEAKVSQALLDQAAQTVARLAGGTSARFLGDGSTAVAHAVLDVALTGDFEVVACSAADPLIVQDASLAAASQIGLQHVVVPVDARGRLAELPDRRTVLVTSAVNQEIGSVQRDLSQWLSDRGGALVLEASSALGWVELPGYWDRLVLDPRAWGSVAGAVAVVSRSAAQPAVFDNVAAAVTAGLSGERWLQVATQQREHVREQTARLLDRIRARVADVDIHGGQSDDAPHIVSLSVLYVDAEALQTRLDTRGYAVGSGSACASRSGQPSHVLAAIGGLTSGNVRVGLPPALPDQAVLGLADAFADVVGQIREEMGTAGL